MERKCKSCGKELNRKQTTYCSASCQALGLRKPKDGRNCLNAACGKPLIRRQKMYCSNKCKFAGRSSPKAEKVWELRKSNPELSVGELAKAIGTTKGYVETSLYINKHRPSDLLKRKYKPRQPKKEVIEPEPEPEPEPPPEPVKEPEPLPEGKYGKHVAPGWLWNGAGALEEKYGHLGERKKK